jgi:hypothetical protein
VKKIVFTTGVLLVLCAAVLMPSAVRAADVSVGGSMWVSQWEPFFTQSMKKSIDQLTTADYKYSSKVDVDTGLVCGPLVSVRLGDSLSWGNMLLVGKYDGILKMRVVETATGNSQSSEMKFTTWRGDIDSTLNYSLNRYFKVFGGVKCMYMEYAMSSEGDDSNTNSKGVGPALGVSLSLPLTDNLFGVFNVSSLYLRTVMDPAEGKDMWFNVLGGNTTLSLAYYFSSLSLTASAGVRYQQLRYFESTSGTGMDKSDDKFYGLVFSLIYTF